MRAWAPESCAIRASAAAMWVPEAEAPTATGTRPRTSLTTVFDYLPPLVVGEPVRLAGDPQHGEARDAGLERPLHQPRQPVTVQRAAVA